MNLDTDILYDMELDEGLKYLEEHRDNIFPDMMKMYTGILHEHDGNFMKAAEYYREALQLNPDQYLAHLGLGRYYHVYVVDHEQAFAFLEDAVKLYPCSETFYFCGMVYEASDYDRAISYLEQALEGYEDDQWFFEKSNIYEDLGIIYRRAGRIDDAVAIFRRCTDEHFTPEYYIIDAYIAGERYEEGLEVAACFMQGKSETDSRILEMTARMYRFTGKYELSLEAYKELITYNKAHHYTTLVPYYQNDMAEIYYRHLGNHVKAEEILSEILRQHPEDYSSYMFLISLYNYTENYAKLIALLDSDIIESFRGKSYYAQSFYYNLSIAHQKLGEYDKAIEYCLLRIEDDPGDYDVYDRLIRICYDKGNLEFAIQKIDEALKHEGREGILRTAMNTLLDLECFEYALNIADEMICRKYKISDALFNRARILSDLGRYEEALKYHELYEKEEPKDIRHYVNKFNSHYDLGMTDEALEDAERVIESDLEDIKHIALWQKGGLLYDQGNLEEALESYEKAAELNPWYKGIMTDLTEIYIVCGRFDRALEYCKDYLGKQTDTFSVLVCHFLKFVIYLLAGNNEGAVREESLYKDTGLLCRDGNLFTIEKIIRYAPADEEQRDHIRRTGMLYLSCD